MMPDITTLKHRNDLGAWLNDAGIGGLGVEVGVQVGEYANHLLSTWRGSGLFLIDPWSKLSHEQYPDPTGKIDMDAAHQQTHHMLTRHPGRAIVLRMVSDEAANVLRGIRLSFVYLDGNHSTPQFNRDLVNYYPLTNLLCGHDYEDVETKEYNCNVRSVVNKFVLKHGLKLHLTNEGDRTSWWIYDS